MAVFCLYLNSSRRADSMDQRKMTGRYRDRKRLPFSSSVLRFLCHLGRRDLTLDGKCEKDLFWSTTWSSFRMFSNTRENADAAFLRHIARALRSFSDRNLEINDGRRRVVVRRIFSTPVKVARLFR